jgi:hypothetical protein
MAGTAEDDQQGGLQRLADALGACGMVDPRKHGDALFFQGAFQAVGGGGHVMVAFTLTRPPWAAAGPARKTVNRRMRMVFFIGMSPYFLFPALPKSPAWRWRRLPRCTVCT